MVINGQQRHFQKDRHHFHVKYSHDSRSWLDTWPSVLAWLYVGCFLCSHHPSQTRLSVSPPYCYSADLGEPWPAAAHLTGAEVQHRLLPASPPPHEPTLSVAACSSHSRLGSLEENNWWYSGSISYQLCYSSPYINLNFKRIVRTLLYRSAWGSTGSLGQRGAPGNGAGCCWGPSGRGVAHQTEPDLTGPEGTCGWGRGVWASPWKLILPQGR